MCSRLLRLFDRMVHGASVRRSMHHLNKQCPIEAGSYLPFLPVPRGLPASLRFLRQVPSSLRLRGCLPPPGEGTYGPWCGPARRSAMPTASLHSEESARCGHP